MSRMSQPWSCRGGLGRLRGVPGPAEREKGSGAGGEEAASQRRNPFGWAPTHHHVTVKRVSLQHPARTLPGALSPPGRPGRPSPSALPEMSPGDRSSLSSPPRSSPRAVHRQVLGAAAAAAPRKAPAAGNGETTFPRGNRTSGISGSAPRPRITEPSRSEPERRRAPLPAAGPTCTAPPPVPSAAAAAAEARSRGGREDERPPPRPRPRRPPPARPHGPAGGGGRRSARGPGAAATRLKGGGGGAGCADGGPNEELGRGLRQRHPLR